MTCTGNRNVNSRTSSAVPRAGEPVDELVHRVLDESASQWARLFCRNAWDTRLRCRRCSGSSMPTSTYGPMTGAISSRTAADEKVSLSRRHVATSS